MQTFLFYDIETTGLNKAFDQVLQFAAIRTDANLNELERHEIKVKLNPDVIPAPQALITHYIGVKEASEGVSEIEAIKTIHQLLNEPGTISVGYNTLGFDDEFLRFSFYRNLLTPYTHQFANQCGRMDIYPMTIMYFLFKNHVIQWPEIDGKISLKLENINAKNNFYKGRSHHAMVDVEVTLALAQKLFQEKEMWNYLTAYFNKQTDEKRSQNLTNKIGLMVYGKMGAERAYQCPVLFLGHHLHYKNQLWLRLDTEELMKTTADSISETTWVVRKKLAEPGFILPFEEKYLTHFSAERRQLLEKNKNWLLQNPDLLQQITKYHAEYKYPVFPETDVDARLYMNGFLSFDEQRLCQRFHTVSEKEKPNLADSMRNHTLKTLATRILGRHFPNEMSDAQKEDFDDYMQRIAKDDGIIDFRGEKRLTPKAALLTIGELRGGELSEEQKALLDELEDYLGEKFCNTLSS